MSLQVENMEHNMAKLTVEVEAKELDKAIVDVYHRQKNKFQVAGFRKGKVPFALVEKVYGVEMFYEEAANALISREYEKCFDESGLEIVSRPEIDVVQIEKGKPFIFTAMVAVKPEVTLGDYKGLKVKKRRVTVTAKEVEQRIKEEQERNGRTVSVTDRGVENGDDILLDFEGFVEGKAFEGGKGEKFPLTIGSGAFIPGFEEQLVGAKLEEALDVHVTFPEDYQAEELAGKEALFTCTVREIKTKELPELNDEFASEVSEFETYKEYEADVKKKLKEEKTARQKQEKEDELVEQAVKNAKMDIPEAMIDTQARQMADQFGQRMRMQGLSMEQYFQYTGSSMEKMLEELKPQAIRKIETRLVLETIATVEKIEICEEKLDEEIEKMAKAYHMEVDMLKKNLGENEKEQMKQDMAVQEAVTLLLETSIEE